MRAPEPPQLGEASLNTLDSPPSTEPQTISAPLCRRSPLTRMPRSQVARARLGLVTTGTGRAAAGDGTEVSRHMPYSKDLQWLSGEAAYQNS